jgi:hypothetical protein
VSSDPGRVRAVFLAAAEPPGPAARAWLYRALSGSEPPAGG